MPTVPRLDPVGEFFGRMWSIDIACPACGTLHLEKARRRWQRHQRSASVRRAAWEPLTSYFTCHACGAIFVLGLVAWRPPLGHRRWPPADHLPKAWHLARMRELVGAGGFLLSHIERMSIRQEVNLLVEQPCSCTVDADGQPQRNRACAVHGRAPILAAKPDPRWGPKGITWMRKPPKPKRSGT